MKLFLKGGIGEHFGEMNHTPKGNWCRGWAIFLIAMGCSILFARVATADEIIMQNGDRIQGRVVSLSSGKLVFNTPYAGDIKVDWSQVAKLTTDEPLVVVLDNKEVLKGKVVTSTDGKLMIEPESGTPGSPVKMAQVNKLHPPKPPATWKVGASVSAGASRNSGNTNTEAYDFDGQLTLTKFPHDLKFYAEYHWEKDDGEVSKDKGLASIHYNRYVSEKWYLFGNVLGARDKLKDLTFQGNIGCGAGYQFWKSHRKNLSISLGPNYVYERYSKKMKNFGNKDYRRYVAAYWNVDFDIWIFEDILQGFHHDDGTVDVRDGENYQIRTRTGLKFPLKYGLFTSFQYNYDFVNLPADGKKQYDEAYIFKLGWDM